MKIVIDDHTFKIDEYPDIRWYEIADSIVCKMEENILYEWKTISITLCYLHNIMSWPEPENSSFGFGCIVLKLLNTSEGPIPLICFVLCNCFKT